ncbi:hypothetical protein [Desulfovibrio sp.]
MDTQNKKSYSFSVQQSPNSENEHTAIVSVSLCTVDIINAARNDAQAKIQDQMNFMSSQAAYYPSVSTAQKDSAYPVNSNSSTTALPPSQNKHGGGSKLASEKQKDFIKQLADRNRIHIDQLCMDTFSHGSSNMTGAEANEMIKNLKRA